MASTEQTVLSGKISVIIPTRDRCRLVTKAIAGIAKQSFAGIEIMVVDDDSRDDTIGLIRRNFPHVSLIKLEGKGPGAARNAGVKASSGEIIMFLDSDDQWLPDHARKLYDTLLRGFEVAYGTTLNQDLISGGKFLLPDQGKGTEGDCFNQLTKWCFTVPSSFGLTRKAFLQSGGFAEHEDAIPGEDWDFFLRLAAHYKFGFAGATPISLRQLHPGSICANTDSQAIIIMLKRIQATATRLKGHDQQLTHRFKTMEQFIIKKGKQWESIQAWHMAMKKANLL